MGACGRDIPDVLCDGFLALGSHHLSASMLPAYRETRESAHVAPCHGSLAILTLATEPIASTMRRVLDEQRA